MLDVYLMSKDEGNSFNRLAGIFGCKNPKTEDHNRIIAVMRKIKENTELAYSNGIRVEEKHLNKVLEIV